MPLRVLGGVEVGRRLKRQGDAGDRPTKPDL
jgi:hypothetical protein